MPMVPRSLENKVYNSLKRLFFDFINDIRNGFIKRSQIPDAARKFLDSEEVDQYLNNLMTKMTSRIRIDSAREMKQKAVENGNGALLYSLISNEMNGPVGRKVWEIIANNVQYIKTVPQDWATYISNYAAREALKGRRPEQIEADLRKIMPEHMTKNLKCIARTECAKANAAIVQARAEAVGAKCYFWRCVKDERSRDSHIGMDGILVFYDDPPSPEALFGGKPYGKYHAGNTFNCRCYQEVVVDLRFLPESFRYYRDGKIMTITKAAFTRQFGNAA